MQCGNCQSFIAGDPDGRLPPWCPTCGADLKKKQTNAAVTSAAAGPPSNAHHEQAEEPEVVEPAEPPMLSPARQAYMPVNELRAHSNEYLKRTASGPSAAARMAAAICTILGVVVGSLVIAPRVFPQPAGGFSIEQVGLAGLLGGAAGAIGWLIGKVIDSGRSS